MATLDSVQVKDYMNAQPLTFRPDMEVMAAINQLVKHGLSGAPVVDADGRLVGMLSEKDCMQVGLIAAQDTCVAGPVSQLMSTQLTTVTLDTNLTQMATMFISRSFRRYPVVDGNGKLVGLISRSDVLRAISSLC